MKRPSFQMYQGDWLSNAKLRRCSKAERGIWIDTMCTMADSDEFGVLRWPLKDLANAVGCRVAELQALRDKGVLKGADAGEQMPALIYTPRHAGKVGEPVELLPAQSGPIWYSSRMVRDEYIRTKRATNGAEDSAPKPPIGDHPSRAQARLPAQSSSPSASRSSKAPSAAGAAQPGFEEAWKALPKRAGNNPKSRALRAYGARLAQGCTDTEILEGVRRYAAFCRATGKEDSEYVMQGATFFGPELLFRQAWTVANGNGEWWKSDQATLDKGKELGVPTRPGESMNDYRSRIREKLAAPA